MTGLAAKTLKKKTLKSIGIANVWNVAGGLPALQKVGDETESTACNGS